MSTIDRRAILTGAAAAIPAAAIPAVPALAAPDDSELLALGAQLTAAVAAEKALPGSAPDEDLDALLDASRAIVDQIVVMQATTLAGLQVKARAILWACTTVDNPMVESLLDDLQAMESAS